MALEKATARTATTTLVLTHASLETDQYVLSALTGVAGMNTEIATDQSKAVTINSDHANAVGDENR